MKKRFFALFCALMLCLGLMIPLTSLGATSNPCFLAINDNLLNLEARFIPIAIDGQYYVPYTALDSSTTGLELGISSIYYATLNRLTIYNRTQSLIFDLSSGTCTDRNGASREVRAVNRNGRIYVPARFICEYFGLAYSSRITTYGPLVRIRSSSSKLDDAVFVERAQGQMADRLREWRRSQSTAEPPAVSTTPVYTPPPTPSVTSVPEDPEIDKSGVHTYLSFRADQTEGLADILAELEQYQVQALFFFPAAELADYDDAVRSVLCGGHSVGLLITGATAEEVTAQATEGNRILAKIAHLSANAVLLPDVEDDAEQQKIEDAGLLCWHTSVNALSDGRSASRQASTALGNIDRYRYEVYILSDTSIAGAAMFRLLLPELVQARYDLRLAVETEL